ncbi:Enoyl-[acyl-carrier-protein] reductase, mitochondrialial [Coccomyxa sp. Obi]|nr:Enoyl-[acyl-carrier-protein] reductase, mitochondrialial [Coccomyxa sp. Obi]
MLYRPINPSDIFCVQGTYGGWHPKLPAVPGLEGMGVIEKLGPQPSAPSTETARKLKEGQRVVGVPWPSAEGEGTWQQFVAAPLENLIPVKDGISNEDAAQYLVNPVTALGFLEDLRIPKGKYLLQNAANSVLGRQIISLAKKRGVKTINVVRRDEVVNELKGIGADEVINSKTEDIVARVKEITGQEGAWAAINPIGGPSSRPFFSAVRNSGFVYIYSMYGDEVIVPMYDLHFRDITVRGFWLNVWLNRLPKDVREKELLEVMDLLADGTLKPPPARAKYPLTDVKKAMEDALSTPGYKGKVLLKD